MVYISLALQDSSSSALSIGGYRHSVSLRVDKDPYTLKTVETEWELQQALQLRAEVFFEDPAHPLHGNLVDMDAYDTTCDHIVIIDNRIDTIVGTYRVRTTKHNRDFYSEQEFNLNSILDLDGGKLELGRACVKKGHRSGSIISLLWRGIARYALYTDSKYLFGCSSVFTTDAREAAEVFTYLKKQGYMSEDSTAHPTPEYQFHKFDSVVRLVEANYDQIDESVVKSKIPTLFHSYLKSGAKVCAEPALDVEFNCVDFLTLLDLEKLNRLFAKRYQD